MKQNFDGSGLKPLVGLRKDRIYRIDYLGHIRSNLSSNMNFLVDIYLSELTRGIEHGSAYKILKAKPFDTVKSLIGIGDLYGFRPGSLIIDGGIKAPPYTNMHLFEEELLINKSNVRIVKAGDKCEINERKPLIPMNTIKLGRALGSNLVSVKVDSEHIYEILIPVMEMARYYYSSSTKYTQKLFSYDITDISQLVRDYAYPGESEDGNHFVRLAFGLRRVDAWQAARLRFSKHAYNNAIGIWNSMADQVLNDHATFVSPKVLFPFEGMTRLKALVHWIPIDKTDKGATRFRALVSHIIECSHPFPYNDLTAVLSNDNDRSTNNDPIDRSKRKGYNPITRKPGKPNPGVGHTDPQENPNSLFEPLEIGFDTNSFGHIKNKELHKPEKLDCEYRSVKKNDESPIETENQSSSEGVKSESKTQETHHIPLKKRVTADLLLFLKLIPIFNQNEDIHHCEPVVFNPQGSGNSMLNAFETKDSNNKRIHWAVMLKGEELKDDIARSAAILHIKIENRNICIF